jgi:hypothetical protein
MPNSIIANYDALTGFSEVREMTDAEHAQWLLDIQEEATELEAPTTLE